VETTAYLGLGTNLGDRSANLRQAIAELVCEGLQVGRLSSPYETAPRDVFDQPSFLNQVIEVRTAMTPRELLDHCKRVEHRMGRVKVREKGPRLIDADILLYGDAQVAEPGLTIPHAALTTRRFVLEPLCELAPNLRVPGTPYTVAGWLTTVQEQVVQRVR
jgi:2-amino-4-hydroxy-6-hydroxymethyldihydropteridine diphosphokinase